MSEKKVLPDELRDKAEKLALQSYIVEIIKDKDSEGNPLFLAVNTELDGCMAHGKTYEEAIENLKDARTDYIQVLLLNNQSVPIPYNMVIVYTGQAETVQLEKTYTVRKKNKLVDISNGKQVLVEYDFNLLPCDV